MPTEVLRRVGSWASAVLSSAVAVPAFAVPVFEVLVFAALALPAQAQSGSALPDAPPAHAADQERGTSFRHLPRNILQDQQALFTLPLRMRGHQWMAALPLGVAATVLVASDTAVESHVTTNPETAKRYSTFSNAGLVALAGAGAGMYAWGALAGNEHLRETGFLSGEAAIDAYLSTALIKSVAGRDRPFTDNGRGEFFDGGTSFPSGHAAISWAIASVIAHEYPGPATKLLSYGLAAAVSAARVQAREHFLSDVVIGSALGWYLGRQVYRARSASPEIDVRKWGKFERDEESEQRDAAARLGSSYVPLDSWTNAAFDRLEGMGYLPTASQIVRPWTRMESARLLAEAHANVEDDESAERAAVAAPLLAALDAELAHETGLIAGERNAGAQVESVYARFTGISGTPLRDSFHFAQTLTDDNGRPYGQGANAIVGIAQRAEAGPLAFYLRAEYQYASALPAYNLAAQQAIADSDGLPFGWNLRSGSTSRLRTVEAYAAVNLSGWQLSFGQQNLWWGPDRTTSMILSNNAEALPMLRLERVSPMRLPGFLGGLGPARANLFFARQGGVHYVRLGPELVLNGSPSQGLDPPPYLWGFSLSLKPTPNLELGFGHTTIFAGLGRPLNLDTFLHTFSLEGNAQPVDPGKRTTEFSFIYHVPGLRRRLVAYSELYSYDTPWDGNFLKRYSMNPGLYFPQFPGVRNLDLRLEGVNTNLPGLNHQAYFYANAHYPQGYTNYGQILGSWIGRQGTGGTALATYWFSARNRLSAGYRQMVADESFLQGGRLQDVSGHVTWMLRPGIEVSAMAQYEWWNFPLLAAETRTDVAAGFELRFFPMARLGSKPVELRAASRQP